MSPLVRLREICNTRVLAALRTIQMENQMSNKVVVSTTLNGDPVDPEILDNFAFEVHERFKQREASDSKSEGHRKSGSKRAAVARLFARR